MLARQMYGVTFLACRWSPQYIQNNHKQQKNVAHTRVKEQESVILPLSDSLLDCTKCCVAQMGALAYQTATYNPLFLLIVHFSITIRKTF